MVSFVWCIAISHTYTYSRTKHAWIFYYYLDSFIFYVASRPRQIWPELKRESKKSERKSGSTGDEKKGENKKMNNFFVLVFDFLLFPSFRSFPLFSHLFLFSHFFPSVHFCFTFLPGPKSLPHLFSHSHSHSHAFTSHPHPFQVHTLTCHALACRWPSTATWLWLQLDYSTHLSKHNSTSLLFICCTSAFPSKIFTLLICSHYLGFAIRWKRSTFSKHSSILVWLLATSLKQEFHSLRSLSFNLDHFVS